MGSLFDKNKVKGQKPNQGANYMRPGMYWARIDNTKIAENRKGQGLGVIEMTIIKTIGDCEHQVGESVSKVVREDSDYFYPDLLAFVQAATGEDMTSASDDEKSEALKLVFEGTNPLANSIVEVHAKTIVTEKGGNFTVVTFQGEIPASQVKADLDESVVALYFPGDMLDVMIAEEND